MKRTLSQEVWSATLWNTLLLPARFVVGLITSVIYFQVLAPEQVGLIFLLTNLAGTLGLYADLGIERALPRFLPEVERQGGREAVRRFMQQILKLKLAIMLVLIVVLNLVAGPLGSYLANQQTEQIARLEQQAAQVQTTPSPQTSLAEIERQIAASQSLVTQIETRGRWFVAAVTALLIFGAIFDVYMQFLTAYFKQRAWNIITLVTSLVQPILVTILLLLGWGITGVLVGLVVTPLVSVALAVWQTSQVTRTMAVPSDPQPLDPNLRRRFAAFAGVSYLMQISTWFYDLSFVLFVLAATLGSYEIAILGFAYKFAKDYLAYVWTPLGGVITPLLTRIKVGRDQTALEDAHASLTRILLLLLVPAGVGLAIMAPAMVQVLYPTYTPAVTLIVIFVGFTFGESVLSVPHNVLMVYEQYRVVIVSRIVALLSVPLVLLLLPRYGLIGVAIAVGVARVGSRLVTVVYGVRRLGLPLPIGFGLRVIAATASFAVVLLTLLRWWSAPAVVGTTLGKLIALLPLLGLVVLGVVLYGLAMRLTGGLDEAERRRLLAMRLPFKQTLSRIL